MRLIHAGEVDAAAVQILQQGTIEGPFAAYAGAREELTRLGAWLENTTIVPLDDPGRCVPVDIAATAETAALLADTASHFNGSSFARLPGGGCAFVRVETVDSPIAMRELTDNWPDSARLGPAPVAWVPGSTMWGELLNARLTDQHRRPMAKRGKRERCSPRSGRESRSPRLQTGDKDRQNF